MRTPPDVLLSLSSFLLPQPDFDFRPVVKRQLVLEGTFETSTGRPFFSSVQDLVISFIILGVFLIQLTSGFPSIRLKAFPFFPVASDQLYVLFKTVLFIFSSLFGYPVELPCQDIIKGPTDQSAPGPEFVLYSLTSPVVPFRPGFIVFDPTYNVKYRGTVGSSFSNPPGFLFNSTRGSSVRVMVVAMH